MQKEIKPQILEHKEKHSEKGNKEHKEEKENKEKISDIKQRFEETTQVNSFQNKDALNVGIVGHIDHGKTTILHRLTGVWADKHSEELKRGITIKLGYADLLIRKCIVCGKYVNEEKCTYCKGKTEIAKNISFIDAPGHEMLMATMLGGAAIIDTALLVVAANEPFPQPQTKEHLLALDVKGVKSVIIVQNKLDLITKEQALEQFKKIKEFIKGSIAEKAEIVPICAQQGVNMDVLFDVLNNIPIPERDLISKPLFLIARTFDINRPGTNVCELKGGVFGGTLKRGKLKVGDILYAEKTECKVRGLFDYQGKGVKEILPGEPGQILGFSVLPDVGSIISTDKSLIKENVKVTTRKDQFKKIQEDELPVILKAKSIGALEALESSLPPKVVVVNSSVGDVLESDILMAKSTGARVFAFESGIPNSVLKLAEAEKVKTYKFKIIYELIDKLQEILAGGKEEILGKAEVIAEFPFNDKRVAGCKVTNGKIVKAANLYLERGGKEVGRIKVLSLKKAKQEVVEVKPGEEFGILFEPQFDFAIGDVVVSVAK